MPDTQQNQNLCGPIVADMDYLQDLRRKIHAHPELAFEEEQTAKLVASALSEAGLEVTTNVGQTGVVGSLSNGTSSRAIGLRADMDALPMDEATDLPYKSRQAGKFHGCGHDGHTTMLLGAARHLAQHRDFDGTIHFIFQPAEEGAGGAAAMIKDGLFERFPMDSVFGMHNFPTLPVGQFSMRSGPFLAAYQPFDITVRGIGGHGALPHTSIDPLPIAAQIIQSLQTIISRAIDPIETGVLSITKCHAGDAYNVIPHKATLGGSIRYFDEGVGESIRDKIKSLVEGIAKANGATAVVNFPSIYYPPLCNTDTETGLAQSAAEALVGANNVECEQDRLMGSDDFAEMLREKPGCYILIGNGSEDDGYGACMVHNPEYDFNDEITPIGASYWVKLVETALPVSK